MLAPWLFVRPRYPLALGAAGQMILAAAVAPVKSEFEGCALSGSRRLVSRVVSHLLQADAQARPHITLRPSVDPPRKGEIVHRQFAMIPCLLHTLTYCRRR